MEKQRYLALRESLCCLLRGSLTEDYDGVREYFAQKSVMQSEDLTQTQDMMQVQNKKQTQDRMQTQIMTAEAWNQLLNMAGRHGVLALIYESLKSLPVPEGLLQKARANAQVTVRQNYRLLAMDAQILKALTDQDIQVTLLKGMGTASLYPIPEVRKSGDIDLLLLDVDQLERAIECMKQIGFAVEEVQLALHHVVMGRELPGDLPGGKAKIEVELHTMLAEPFDEIKVNQLLETQVKECGAHLKTTEVAGVELTVLQDSYHAYELLLHMLQHFLRSGFGLKLLCDWVVFWNRPIEDEEKSRYLELASSCGIKRFSDLITLTCVKYLGLQEDKVAFMQLAGDLSPEDFLEEIWEAEEFGKSSKDRMVALRGNGVMDYVREFHHQMHLNFPEAGKCFLLWPWLWTVTLIRFLVNNYKIRKVSLKSVLKKAGQRGKIIKKLHLFRY